MCICDVRPGDDVVDSAAVLVLHRRANVCEFAVFEDEDVVGGCEGLEGGYEGFDGVWGGEGDYVDVRFDEAEFGTKAWVRG